MKTTPPGVVPGLTIVADQYLRKALSRQTQRCLQTGCSPIPGAPAQTRKSEYSTLPSYFAHFLSYEQESSLQIYDFLPQNISQVMSERLFLNITGKRHVVMFLHIFLLVLPFAWFLLPAPHMAPNQVRNLGSRSLRSMGYAAFAWAYPCCSAISLTGSSRRHSPVRSVFSLLFLGCLKLTDSSIRQYLRHHKEVRKDIHFTFSQLRFIINIYSDPMEADADQSHCLSWKEAIFFSLAMSIDSLIAGTMAAFLKISVPLTVAATFAMGEGLHLSRPVPRA